MTEMRKRVLVCGGRDFKPTPQQVTDFYNAMMRQGMMARDDAAWWPVADLVCGMARGADWWAYEFWLQYPTLNIYKFPADWERLGKAAGFKRNVQMLGEGKPDAVIAFPGGKGTKMMVSLSLKAGVPVEIIE